MLIASLLFSPFKDGSYTPSIFFTIFRHCLLSWHCLIKSDTSPITIVDIVVVDVAIVVDVAEVVAVVGVG